MGDEGVSTASPSSVFNLLIVYSGDKDLEVGKPLSYSFTTQGELLI